MPRVRFSITGEYLTDLARTLTLEGNHEGAIRILSEGNEDKVGLIIKIIKGDAKLIGADDNISVEEDNDVEYKELLQKFYNGFCFIDGQWVKPYRSVNTITKKTVLTDQRILFYKENDDDVYDVIEFETGPKAVIFKKAYDDNEREIIPPSWLQEELKKDPKKNIEKALETNQNLLEEWGITKEFVEEMIESGTNQTQKDFLNYCMEMHYTEGMISTKAFDEELSSRKKLYSEIYLQYLREKINQQETEWIEIENLRIPKTPFFYWASKTMHIHLEDVKEWKPISPANIKMYGDDPIHTDWVIGAGLDPSTFYRSKEEEQLLSFIFSLSRKRMIVINGKGTITGTITKDPTKVNETSILVIPHAGIEYFEAAKKAKAVISAVGGPAAHLVVNSKEYNIKFAIVLNAMTTFEENSKVTMFFDIQSYKREKEEE